jgi:hypothetical protein
MPPNSKKNSRPATPAVLLPETAADTSKIPVDNLKNLRGAVLLAAIGEVYASNTTNTEGKHLEMEKNFWGDVTSDRASLLSKMVKGEGPFAVN